MLVTMLKGKIHRATVTQAERDYVGSITLDEDLLDAAGICEYERVEIANVDNGQRLATYAIAGERGSGIVCLNGAAAHCATPGDTVIIMAYGAVDAQAAPTCAPCVVFVDAQNKPVRVTRYERHGKLADQA